MTAPPAPLCRDKRAQGASCPAFSHESRQEAWITCSPGARAWEEAEAGAESPGHLPKETGAAGGETVTQESRTCAQEAGRGQTSGRVSRAALGPWLLSRPSFQCEESTRWEGTGASEFGSSAPEVRGFCVVGMEEPPTTGTFSLRGPTLEMGTSPVRASAATEISRAEFTGHTASTLAHPGLTLVFPSSEITPPIPRFRGLPGTCTHLHVSESVVHLS